MVTQILSRDGSSLIFGMIHTSAKASPLNNPHSVPVTTRTLWIIPSRSRRQALADGTYENFTSMRGRWVLPTPFKRGTLMT